MKLSEHFTLNEMTASVTAGRLHIDNSAPVFVIANLRKTSELLEQVRALLGGPVIVSSGYRSPELNRAVGGAATSAHVQGLAADFICPRAGDPLHVCQKIAASDIEFQQLIFEGTWVHIAAPPEGTAARRQVLTARFGNGTVWYSSGLQT